MIDSDPLDAVAWPVHTPRLLLRRAAGGDAEAVWSYRRLAEVQDWLASPSADGDAFRTRFSQRLATTLIVECDGRVIGDLMLRIEDGWAQDEVADRARSTQAELGWTLDPACGGRGLATEAVRAAIDICFGPLGLRRIHAGCFLDNDRSWRLMERLGMRREMHTVRDSLHRRLGWLDGVSYALLAEEWPTAR